MRSYLSLIPISANVRKKQNRLTLLCIIFAVFLVTAIFSMADMGFQMEKSRLLQKHAGLSLGDLLNNPMAQTLFISAGVLFILVLIAGVLMVSSSMNSNIAQRTRFFGMMRCIGMSKKQVVRFVRLEALNWCKTAVPIGVILGVVTAWGLGLVLKFIVGEEFTEIPLFRFSFIGIVSGILVGVITVLIAAKSPANRAVKVSPVSATAGNAGNTIATMQAANTKFSKVETSLGVSHAAAAKKNFAIRVSSFALSILLFLSFSVLIEFVSYLMPQYSNTPDINITSDKKPNSIDNKLVGKISTMDGVKHVYGRSNRFNEPVTWNKNTNLPNKADIISFDEFDMYALEKDGILKKNSDISKVLEFHNCALAIGDPDAPLDIGDRVTVNNSKVEITGILKYDPFSDDGKANGKITLITSKDTFTNLTGESGYSLVMVQTSKRATDNDVQQIRTIVNKKYSFQDVRDQRTTSTFIAFQICIYGFLSIIALVTVLNIMNSISMSVSARIRQYGMMRAIGMSTRQGTKMIAAEAITYAIAGCVIGCILGLLVNYSLFKVLISDHFDYAAWSIPVRPLLVILVFTVLSVAVSIYTPSKRIKNLTITETINRN